MRRAWLALAVLAGLGCSAGRIPRIGGEPPPAFDSSAREHGYQDVLERFTRSQALYDNLDTNVFLRATWQSPTFVEARVARVATFQGMPPEAAAQALAAERARLGDAVEFFLAVHVNDSRHDDFGRPGSLWRLALETDGREVLPTSVERLGRTNVQLQSVYSYLEAFWVGYRVRFPHVDLRPGQHFSLRVASALGRAELPFISE